MTALKPITTAAVVGAGTMGSGIAQIFAQAGIRVTLHDTEADALLRADAAIRSSLTRLVAKSLIGAAAADAVPARITPTQSLERCAHADLVVEAIVEDVQAKQSVFRQLDVLCRPDVPLASNTSSVSISLLAAATQRKERVLGMHFMNPVQLMPLVEVVRGRDTSPQIVEVVRRLCVRLGKTAIEAADRPGFIANRILMPMINEAVYALMEGVGAAKDIDGVMTLGMRHPMGPLALADFIGLDVCLAILDVMRDGLGDDKYEACPLLRKMVAAGHLGRKTGRGFYSYP